MFTIIFLILQVPILPEHRVHSHIRGRDDLGDAGDRAQVLRPGEMARLRWFHRALVRLRDVCRWGWCDEVLSVVQDPQIGEEVE